MRESNAGTGFSLVPDDDRGSEEIEDQSVPIKFDRDLVLPEVGDAGAAALVFGDDQDAGEELGQEMGAGISFAVPQQPLSSEALPVIEKDGGDQREGERVNPVIDLVMDRSARGRWEAITRYGELPSFPFDDVAQALVVKRVREDVPDSGEADAGHVGHDEVEAAAAPQRVPAPSPPDRPARAGNAQRKAPRTGGGRWWLSYAALGVAALVVGLYLAKLLAGPSHYVRLTLDAPADAVDVVGDFNNWRPGVNRMERVPGGVRWEVWLRLKPGRYNFGYLVDGQSVTLPGESGILDVSERGSAPVLIDGRVLR